MSSILRTFARFFVSKDPFMIKLPYYPKEYKALFRLGLPITIAQVGMTLQGMVDVLMVGHHSAEELAAVGFVNSLLLLAMLLSLGYCQAAIPQIGALFSQKRYQEIMCVLKSSMVANVLQGLFIGILMLVIWWLMPHFGLDSKLLPLMRSYYIILLPSLVVFAFAHTFKAFFDSINDTRTPMWILLAGNLLNVFLNWLLIYGRWGFPEMGSDGAAWATVVSRLFIIVAFFVNFFCNKRYASYLEHWTSARVEKRRMQVQNGMGWPIALQMTIETMAFSGVSLLLGLGGITWDATTALSAHQVMVQLASFVYMFYIGIGSAIAIRVSNYHGLEDRQGARDAAAAGYEMILVVGIVSSIIAFGARYEVTALFLSADDPAMLSRVSAIVAAMAYPLVAYQFGDGMQSAYVNALRGYGDVKVLMKYCFLAYAIVSIPLSYLFGIVMDHGAVGIWWGFPFGLTLAAGLYLKRFYKITRIRI